MASSRTTRRLFRGGVRGLAIEVAVVLVLLLVGWAAAELIIWLV